MTRIVNPSSDSPGSHEIGRFRLSRRRYCGLLLASSFGTYHTAAAVAQDTDRAEADRKAIAEFVEAYRLAPGQVLKRVPPPRPPGMRAWWAKTHPNHGNRPDQFGSMTFRWRDPDRLTSWAMTSADAFSLRSLLRYIETDIYETEIDGDRKLLDANVDGDWIYREGATVEQKVHALENIIQRALRLRISLAFRKVERDVVVVRGNYRSSPVEGRKADQIEIYGKQILPNGGGAGGGSGDFAMFLKWVGEWIERPVVGEVEAPPREVSWYYNARSPFTKEMRREDHDEGLVLKHLAEQTGLTFTRERRVIRVLFVEKAR